MDLNPLRWLSKVPSLPGIDLLSPSAEREPLTDNLQGFAACQTLAFQCAEETAALLQPGWTEKQTAELMETFLRDHGVKAFFHHPFVWFGDRTRFRGVDSYGAYQPTDRRVQENEVFILDVAPILHGYTCDIGYTGSLGPNPTLDRVKRFLSTLRGQIPALFDSGKTGAEIWETLDQEITSAGYDNIHKLYPFGVLGHRVHAALPAALSQAKLLHFGWQSYWSLLSRGLFGQLLNADFAGGLIGLWAIEPHLGTPGFGAKFEEILVVTKSGSYWLKDKVHAT